MFDRPIWVLDWRYIDSPERASDVDIIKKGA